MKHFVPTQPRKSDKKREKGRVKERGGERKKRKGNR